MLNLYIWQIRCWTRCISSTPSHFSTHAVSFNSVNFLDWQTDRQTKPAAYTWGEPETAWEHSSRLCTALYSSYWGHLFWQEPLHTVIWHMVDIIPDCTSLPTSTMLTPLIHGAHALGRVEVWACTVRWVDARARGYGTVMGALLF